MQPWLREQEAIAANFIGWRPMSEFELAMLIVITKQARLAGLSIFVEVLKDGIFFLVNPLAKRFAIYVRNATQEDISVTDYARLRGCEVPPFRSIEDFSHSFATLEKPLFAVLGEAQ